MTDFFAPLRKYANKTSRLPEGLLPHAMTGQYKGCYFIVSESDDGFIMASLSRPNAARVTRSQENKFFKMWGIERPSQRIEMPRSTQFVVERRQ